MSANGRRRPPRPRIELAGVADPREAAAVTAAIEQFLVDTAPAPMAGPPVSRWQRAALLEGVGAKDIFGPAGPEGRGPWQ